MRILNPFKKHHLDACCGFDFTRPFLDYIYFVEGMAYVCNATIGVAASLSDFDAEKELILVLNNYKITGEDFKVLNQHDYLYFVEKGTIDLNESGTLRLNLKKITDEDEQEKYKLVLKLFSDVKKESEQIFVDRMMLNLNFLSIIGKVFDDYTGARFKWFKNSFNVYLEMSNYKNSYALISPMRDDYYEGSTYSDSLRTKQSGKDESIIQEPTTLFNYE